MKISVIIPVYNPPDDHLNATLAALRGQTLPVTDWELVVVDNRSVPPVGSAAAGWHPHGKVVREEKPGLVAARHRGFKETTGDVIVVIDQDNVLDPDYLEKVLQISSTHPWLGAWGGVMTPRFERPDLAPPQSLYPLLTLRSATQDLWSNDLDHHDSTPWGAGLCLRRAVADAYGAALVENPLKGSLDLCGDRRLSGGDTDISYTACALGLGKGVFKDLRLEHLIPAERCTAAYLCKTAAGRGYSEVLHHVVLKGKPPLQATGPGTWLRRLWRNRRLSPLERKVEAAAREGSRQAHAEFARR